MFGKKENNNDEGDCYKFFVSYWYDVRVVFDRPINSDQIRPHESLAVELILQTTDPSGPNVREKRKLATKYYCKFVTMY